MSDNTTTPDQAATAASKSQQKVRTPSSPRSPSVMSPRGDNLSVSSHNINESDKGYLDTRQFALVDPTQFQSTADKSLEGANFDWVLGGKRSPNSDHKPCK